MTYKRLKEMDLSGKSVLLRLDLNAPIQDGIVTNKERLLRSLPTLDYILESGASLIIMSHLGRPEEDNQFQKEFSLKPVVKELENLLSCSIPLYSLDEIEAKKNKIQTIIALENTRFYIGEKTNNSDLSRRFSNLADIFVMDAFATSHRAHASTTGVITFSQDACAGLLLDEELNALTKVKQNGNNSIAILGGSKISTKLGLIDSLSESMDKVILGGGIANTCIAAQGFNIGKSLIEESMLKEAEQLSKNPKIIIPQTVIVSSSPDIPGRETSIDKISDEESIFDISPEALLQIADIITQAKTILWNGPIGFFEKDNFDKGTMKLADMIAVSSGYTVAGGGDTISAANKAGVLDKIDYVSTAGGAFLEFIEGRTLPAIKALKEK
ncbi:MAG: phosphoglycerate kinase [SAR86 cluster bacterium]|nr:phosphoglycerate kinase [SAR86 cluster bacterium]